MKIPIIIFFLIYLNFTGKTVFYHVIKLIINFRVIYLFKINLLNLIIFKLGECADIGNCSKNIYINFSIIIYYIFLKH